MSDWHGDPERGCGLLLVAGAWLVAAMLVAALVLAIDSIRRMVGR